MCSNHSTSENIFVWLSDAVDATGAVVSSALRSPFLSTRLANALKNPVLNVATARHEGPAVCVIVGMMVARKWRHDRSSRGEEAYMGQVHPVEEVCLAGRRCPSHHRREGALKVETSARLVERLTDVRVLAKTGEWLECRQHVLIAVWTS